MAHHILVFDSGLGGFTILQEIQARLPIAHYSYLVDNAAFPYGDKNDQWLINRARSLFAKVIPIAQPDLIVIACNTASTLLLDELRDKFSIPMIGVVPAIKPAAKISNNKKIGLLATRATIHRDYIDQLQTQHASECKLFRFDGQSLVALAEKQLLNEDMQVTELQPLVDKLLATDEANDIDTMILGCTHFPALKKILSELWPRTINWIDSGEAIARRAENLCREIVPQNKKKTGVLYHTNGQHKSKMLDNLKRYNIHLTKHIVI